MLEDMESDGHLEDARALPATRQTQADASLAARVDVMDAKLDAIMQLLKKLDERGLAA
jgi:hypothetical protein